MLPSAKAWKYRFSKIGLTESKPMADVSVLVTELPEFMLTTAAGMPG